MRRVAGIVLATIAISITTSCSIVMPPERPTWRVFVLEPAARSTPATSRDASSIAVDSPVVVVAMPESGAGYATRRMAYSRGAGELAYFAAHRWADTPARMLVPLLQDALMQTGAFRAAVASPTRVLGDLVVESEVLSFRQELADDPPRFRAVVRVTLVDAGATATTRSRVFDVEEPMSVAGPAEGVSAANRAVARLLADAAGFCADVATQRATR